VALATTVCPDAGADVSVAIDGGAWEAGSFFDE
jgi:hypothetical protein